MGVDARAAVVALTADGAALARRIADALGDAEVHGLRARVPVVGANAPVAGAKVPETGVGVPETGVGVPETGVGVLETDVGVPEAGDGVPETGVGVPETGVGVPETGVGVPETGVGVPENNAGIREANGSTGMSFDAKDDPVMSLHRHRGAGADVGFDETARHVRALFEAGRPIVGVCAAGILVRAVAPALDDKHAEPPVVAVSEDGAFVAPILGAHRGGVELAERIAAAVNATAAITTAGDRRFRIALDRPPEGWALANPEHYKPFVAALLQGARVRLPPDVEWLAASDLPADDAGTLAILAGDARIEGSPSMLVYHPRRLALGIGCERGATPEEVTALARTCLDKAGLAPGAVGGVFSIDLKADEPAVHALAESLGVPARFFGADVLEAEAPRLRHPSEAVFREVGCHGVAEGAALAAVGPHGALLAGKTKSARATCAIARAPLPLAMDSIGQPRGELHVVGIGPGDADTLTPAARAAIGNAGHVVGYQGYLDLVAGLTRGRAVYPFALGEERDRAGKAIALAVAGERVALVCSGDPGVYAMASLVMEMLDGAADPAARRIAVRVLPGVSALQAAAARAGAPIGHDFCAVSLSDLLTPRAVIEARLAAAAGADFVIALYNPASATRRGMLDRALRILREHRAANTPVIVARNLGRAGERVEVTSLGGLDPARVDMMTVLLVGSSKTRTFALGGADRAYTPRGYAVRRIGGAGERGAST